jgi:hypothetical protein
MGASLLAIAFGLLLFAGILVLVIKGKRVRGEVTAAKAEFLRRVGYEYASGLTVSSSPLRRKMTPDGRLTHRYEVYTEGRSRVTAQGWQLECAARGPVFQLVDRKLLGNLQALLNVTGLSRRTLQIAYPGPHPTGDAALDAHFALFAPDAPSACAMVRQPAMRKALLDLASVCLLADAAGAHFGDPSDANVYASGASRTDINPAPAIRSGMRVHLAVEHLLRRAVGGDPSVERGAS